MFCFCDNSYNIDVLKVVVVGDLQGYDSRLQSWFALPNAFSTSVAATKLQPLQMFGHGVVGPDNSTATGKHRVPQKQMTYGTCMKIVTYHKK